MDLKPYLHRIRQEFPQVTFTRATLPKQGMDHLALFLDNKWVFRFPLNREYTALFPKEVALLKELHGHITVAIPHYEYVSADETCGCYKKIHGKPLTSTGFKRMSPKAQHTIVTELAGFLSELHSFPVSKARKLGVPFEDPHAYLESVKKGYDRYLRAKLTPDERLYSEQLLILSQEYAEKKHPVVMMHNDVRGLHILLTQNNHLAGVIDFGDKAIGDPAKDFSALWDIDPSFIKALYQQYGKKDPTLLSRSLLLRQRGSLSWLAYNAKAGTPQSYDRAYRLFKRTRKLKVE